MHERVVGDLVEPGVELAARGSRVDDAEQKIARPRQLFVGEDERDYVAVERRGAGELVGV